MSALCIILLSLLVLAIAVIAYAVQFTDKVVKENKNLTDALDALEAELERFRDK